jgi:predicted small metal-binding protein
MINQVSCECGHVIHDSDEDRIVEKVQEHVAAAHPELREQVTPEVIRGWIELVP